MTTFWLARHGETDWNREGRWQGQAPEAPTLNATGQAQALGLAMQLQGHELAAIYSSDLQRAKDTARTLAQQLDAPLYLEPRLREVNLGAWEGMLSQDLIRLYPAELREREINPLTARPPGGGETAAEVVERVRAAADDIAREHPSRAVAIVSHGLALAALRCLADLQSLADIYQRIPGNGLPHDVQWPPRVG